MGISRHQFFSLLGIVKIIDPITDAAYAAAEKEIWEQNLESSPHGQLWHTSFHASSFPGDDPRACDRAAVYGLLDIPDPAPTSRWLRGLGDSGKNIEREVVSRWHSYGVLLSAPPDSLHQTSFSDAEHWLTGSSDAIILPRGWTRPHVVEVKSKFHDKVLEMQRLERGPDAKHVRQVKTYIGFAHENPDLFPGLDPCIDGTIYYVSRDDPSVTHEFTFSHDDNFMDAGRNRLASSRDSFIRGDIPQRPQNEGKVIGWSEEPCKFCPLKKHVCKPDWKDNVETLDKSHLIDYAQSLRPSWDYTETRQKVLERWNASDN